MMIPLPQAVLVIVYLCLVTCQAGEFNVAFAESVFANLQETMTKPWNRVNHILFAAFNSKWSSLYTGDKVLTSSAPDYFIQYVDTNNTRQFLWTIFKPFEYEDSSLITIIYYGFENGRFISYSNPSSGGQLTFMKDANNSCIEWNITSRCREFYGGNSTDPFTGIISGPITDAKEYDPRRRPWYIDSLSRGSVWTDPYLFADELTMGITAAQKIITYNGELLGVIGSDCSFATIEAELSRLTSVNDDVFIFIADCEGKLIATSKPGLSLDDNNNPIKANSSAEPLVSEVSLMIEQDESEGGLGGWENSNGTIFSIGIENKGLYWVEALELNDEYGLHWHVVIVELAWCDEGFYPGDFECKLCPSGADCVGGSSLPFPKKGYWYDSEAHNLKNSFYSCPWETCEGFRKASSDDETFNELLSLCFSKSGQLNNSLCNEDSLMCAEGSTGPMCGSCLDGWRYHAAERKCMKCNEKLWLTGFIIIITVISVAGLIFILRHGYFHIPPLFHDLCGQEKLHVPLIGMLYHVDSGVLKVIWSTFQIVQSIAFNINVRFPFPYSTVQSFLSFLDLDYLSVICFNGNYLQEVTIISIIPFFLMITCWIVFILRILYRGIEFGFHSRDMRVLYAQHCHMSLLLIYIVVPTVVGKQFRALNCQEISSKNSYLRVDTSVDCTSDSYKSFIILDSFLILIYLMLSMLFIVLLYRIRDKLKPRAATMELALQLRDRDESLKPIEFLFFDYKPQYWYFEVTDLFRRIVFISVLPLLSQRNSMKAYIGCTLALFSAIYFRELTPYRVEFINVIAVIAQYVILLDFMAALVLDARSLNAIGFSEVGFGCILIGVNVIVIILGIFLAYEEYSASERKYREQREKAIKIEYAADFTRNKFRTTLEYVNERAVPSSHVLCYYYTSLEQAVESVKLNMIPATLIGNGIVVSLNGPMDIAENDPSLEMMSFLAKSREAVICLSLPRRSLCEFPGTHPEHKLYYIPSALLFGMGPFYPPKRKHSSRRVLRASLATPLSTPYSVKRNSRETNPDHGTLDLDVEAIDEEKGIENFANTPVDGVSSFNSPASLGGEFRGTLSNVSTRSSKPADMRSSNGSITGRFSRPLSSKRRSVVPVSPSPGSAGNSPSYSPASSSKHVSSTPQSSASGASHSAVNESSSRSNHHLSLNFSCAVRAYQLKPDGDCLMDPYSEADCMKAPIREYDPNVIEFNKPHDLLEYIEIMNQIREDCNVQGLLPLYHYTNAAAAPFIFEHGFRMSTQGQGDGGVYFSTLGPATYGIGTEDYEKNIIVDCYGEERLDELKEKHKLDVVFVYAANPKLIELAPGGRNNAFMISKQFFETFGTQSNNGQYFLRPDFLVGAF
jgi:hypothetical protein